MKSVLDIFVGCLFMSWKMAVFYQLVSDIMRGTYTCAMATAAYRSGTNLELKVLI